MITKEVKKNQIHDLSEQFSKAKASFLVNCIGLNAGEVTQLRKNLKQNQGDLKVIRNTLARLALKNHEKVKSHYESFMTEANAFVFAYEDPVGVAKVIQGMSGDNVVFKIKAGMFEQNLMSSADVLALSKLPPLQTLRSQFVGLLSTPMTGFVRLLTAVPEGLLRVLKAKEEKGE